MQQTTFALILFMACMQKNESKLMDDFYVVGVNYRKTEAALRGSFAINAAQYQQLLQAAPAYGLDELFVLSTCNRTEIFGFAQNPDQLMELLCSQTAGHSATFKKLAYIKKGRLAIEHLFNVAAGLDSQILGDYEIVGQLKQAVNIARQQNFIGAFTDRLVNGALQASKNIKNQTELSGGTVSVSFAAIQYIREYSSSAAGKKILLIGTGKIGGITCKNMVDYLPAASITLLNRTNLKAVELARNLQVQSALFETLDVQVQEADIIVVATNATTPTICCTQLADAGEKLIIDLSIPYNVEPAARNIPGIQLVNVDELSKLKDETLQKREAEVPKAKRIIAAHIAEFKEWYAMRKHIPVLKAVKNKLQNIHCCKLFTQAAVSNGVGDMNIHSEEKIQLVINTMAVKMRQKNEGGCQYIEAINDYMTATYL